MRTVLRVEFFVALVLTLVTGAWAQATEELLYTFAGGADGSVPEAGLTAGKKGILYGTTESGGIEGDFYCSSGGCGTVFELAPNGGGWQHTVLYTFCSAPSCADGGLPAGVDAAGVILDKKGNLYGTAALGGAASAGAVYELSPSKSGWTETLPYSFGCASGCSPEDGESPVGNLVFDKAGNLYGATGTGFNGSIYGTVFELSPSGGVWTETILQSFGGDNVGIDGGFPSAGPTLDSKGNLFGTTHAFGQNGYGTVYELNASGYSTIYSFTSQDGATSAPVVVKGNNIYGTTDAGGSYACGTVFELSPSKGGWKFRVLYEFTGVSGQDGCYPSSAGIVFHGAEIWGAAEGYDYSCNRGCGVVYKLSPVKGGWTETVVYPFNSVPTELLPS